MMLKVIGHALYLVVIIFIVIFIGSLHSTVSVGVGSTEYQTAAHMGQTFGPWLIPIGFCVYLLLAIKGWLPFVSNK